MKKLITVALVALMATPSFAAVIMLPKGGIIYVPTSRYISPDSDDYQSDDSGLTRYQKKRLTCRTTTSPDEYLCFKEKEQKEKRKGEPVIFYCKTTVLSHRSGTFCTDDRKFFYHERNASGPHPRQERFKK